MLWLKIKTVLCRLAVIPMKTWNNNSRQSKLPPFQRLLHRRTGTHTSILSSAARGRTQRRPIYSPLHLLPAPPPSCFYRPATAAQLSLDLMTSTTAVKWRPDLLPPHFLPAGMCQIKTLPNTDNHTIKVQINVNVTGMTDLWKALHRHLFCHSGRTSNSPQKMSQFFFFFNKQNLLHKREPSSSGLLTCFVALQNKATAPHSWNLQRQTARFKEEAPGQEKSTVTCSLRKMCHNFA